MAILGLAPAAFGGILGGLGGLLNGLGNRPQFNMGQAGALETGSSDTALNSLNSASGYAGPSDYSGSISGQQSLADLYSSMMQSGGTPTADDQSRANSFASSQFGQQRVGLQQEFLRQMQTANQQAALSGRSQNDPILRAKLGQQQQQQSAQLDAGQAGFASQYAQQLPMQRLGFAEGRANALTNIDQTNAASRQQSFSNYAGLAGIAGGIDQSQWNQRFQQASAQFQSDAGQKNPFDIISGAATGGLFGAGLGYRMGS